MTDNLVPHDPYHLHHPKVDHLRENWTSFTSEERLEKFRDLPRPDAEELFLHLGAAEQEEIFCQIPWPERRSWLRLLAPDDAADLIQEHREDERSALIDLLDVDTRADVIALLAYKEDAAGGLMNPQFVRLKPEISVDVAVRYLRAQARKQVETIH